MMCILPSPKCDWIAHFVMFTNALHTHVHCHIHAYLFNFYDLIESCVFHIYFNPVININEFEQTLLIITVLNLANMFTLPLKRKKLLSRLL